ncbi:MAG: DUF4236 domain-containing protein [Clostridiales bacterium]|nr:DUF4236 domain-containing protein [Clostridiales bacterium]
MGLCFRKSITVAPGVKLNLSKSGVSCSFGKKGIRETISSTGRSTTSIGIPGTGVYYKKTTSLKKLGNIFKGKGEETKEKTSKGKGKANASQKAAESAQASAQAAAENAALLEENKARVEQYDSYVTAIKSVHKATDGYIDWEALNRDEIPSGLTKGSEEYKTWENLKKFSERVLEGDVDSYFEIIDEVKPYDDLLDYGSSFEVGTDRKDVLEVEFHVKSDTVVPNIELSLKANGTVSEKEMTKTNYYALVQDYVASTMIRIARDSFALLPIDKVYVHAVDSILNRATGHEDEITILSAEFGRNQLLSLNMEMIDPSDAVSAFKHNMKFAKTTGFKAVERILPV